MLMLISVSVNPIEGDEGLCYSYFQDKETWVCPEDIHINYFASDFIFGGQYSAPLGASLLVLDLGSLVP